MPSSGVALLTRPSTYSPVRLGPRSSGALADIISDVLGLKEIELHGGCSEMGFIPDQELQEVRSRSDIVQIIGEKLSLKRAGRHLKGLCPFHGEKTPSFMVNPEKQIYHCFGCGAGGDVFSFLMKFDGIEFVQAVEQLADRYGVKLSRLGGEDEERLRKSRSEKEIFFKINRLAGRFFYDSLARESVGQKGRTYLKDRAIHDDMIREACLGYAPPEGRAFVHLLHEKKAPLDLAVRLGLVRQGASGDYYDFFRDRLIFAIVSSDGKFLGFSGRALDNTVQPKYLNSPESPIYHKGDSLLGIQMARSSIREKDQSILVEGNFDMLRLHQEGLKNVVAPLGTALTELQVRSLARLTQNFVLIFDGDEAGKKAAERALGIFLPMGISPRVVLLPEGEDPDSFVRKNGIEPLNHLISAAPHLFDVQIEHIYIKEGKDPQGQTRAVREIGRLLALLPGEVEKRLYIQRVAAKFGLPENLFFTEAQSKRGDSRKLSNFSRESNDDSHKLPPMERTILEVVLSGGVIPDVLFKEIDLKDFSHPDLGEVWKILREGFEQRGRLKISEILTYLPEGRSRSLITELSFSGSQWIGMANQEEGAKAAFDCMHQLRVARMRGKLKDLSHEIRQAEAGQDFEKMKELMDQKNQLIKEMMSFH